MLKVLEDKDDFNLSKMKSYLILYRIALSLLKVAFKD